MKQTLMVGLFLCLFYTISHASVEVSDSSDYPVMQEFSKTGIVGGFSFLSLFEESESFHKGNFVLGLGYGFKSNIGINYNNSKVQVPPVSLLFEMPIFQNVGLGVSFGAMRWAKENDLETTYGYYTLSPKLAYHLNLGEKIDLYSGVAVTGRLSTAKIKGGEKRLRKTKFDVGVFVGLRFYLNQTLGVFLEYGNHNVACFRMGLSLKFGN